MELTPVRYETSVRAECLSMDSAVTMRAPGTSPMVDASAGLVHGKIDLVVRHRARRSSTTQTNWRRPGEHRGRGKRKIGFCSLPSFA